MRRFKRPWDRRHRRRADLAIAVALGGDCAVDIALVAIFLGGATELGMAQWLPAYAETTLGYPAWVGGSALLAFSVAMALGRMVVGVIGNRMNPFHIMAWGCATSVGLLLAGSFLPVPRLALAACVAVGFPGSALWPTLLAVTAVVPV